MEPLACGKVALGSCRRHRRGADVRHAPGEARGDETRAYVEHRCTLAGVRTNPFDADAQETIFEMSHGNLRAIDRLALAALHLAAKTPATTVSAAT